MVAQNLFQRFFIRVIMTSFFIFVVCARSLSAEPIQLNSKDYDDVQRLKEDMSSFADNYFTKEMKEQLVGDTFSDPDVDIKTLLSTVNEKADKLSNDLILRTSTFKTRIQDIYEPINNEIAALENKIAAFKMEHLRVEIKDYEEDLYCGWESDKQVNVCVKTSKKPDSSNTISGYFMNQQKKAYGKNAFGQSVPMFLYSDNPDYEQAKDELQRRNDYLNYIKDELAPYKDKTNEQVSNMLHEYLKTLTIAFFHALDKRLNYEKGMAAIQSINDIKSKGYDIGINGFAMPFSLSEDNIMDFNYRGSNDFIMLAEIEDFSKADIFTPLLTIYKPGAFLPKDFNDLKIYPNEKDYFDAELTQRRHITYKGIPFDIDNTYYKLMLSNDSFDIVYEYYKKLYGEGKQPNIRMASWVGTKTNDDNTGSVVGVIVQEVAGVSSSDKVTLIAFIKHK